MRRLAGTASRHSQLLTLASPFWGNYKHLIYWFCVQLCVQYKLCLSVCVCVGRRFWYGWSPLLKLQWLTSFWLISSVMEELLSFNNWLVTHTHRHINHELHIKTDATLEKNTNHQAIIALIAWSSSSPLAFPKPTSLLFKQDHVETRLFGHQRG